MTDDSQLDVEATIKSFPRYAGPPLSDFVIDFLGTRTRTSYVRGLAGGIVEDYPLPMNFHATAIEWAGALAAVCEAGEELVALELGAGWAPWLVSVACAARRKNVRSVRLVGVEGSKKHCEFMRAHFHDNGLDPDDHTLLHGVVGPRDGVAEFPILADPDLDWGTPAILPGSASGGGRFSSLRGAASMALRLLGISRRWRSASAAQTERTPCYSIGALLRPFSAVDLVHIDIQGHEAIVLASAREALSKKVKRVVVGTHSRAIEQRLFNEMSAGGWLLEAEESCLFRQSQGKMMLLRDGCQVWKNLNLARHARHAASRRAA